MAMSLRISRLPHPADHVSPTGRRAQRCQLALAGSRRHVGTLPFAKTALAREPRVKPKTVAASRTPFDDFVSLGEEFPEERQTVQTLSLKWLVGDNEADRRRRRTIHGGFEKWHDHLKSIVGVPWDPTFRRIFWQVVYFTSVAAAVEAYRASGENGHLPDFLPALNVPAGGTLAALSSFALALMLAFRVNGTYARWCEAQFAWGGLLNRSRDLARLAMTYMNDPEDQEQFCRWIIAFAHTLRCHLLEDTNIFDPLAQTLTSKEMVLLTNSKHSPNFSLQVASEIVKSSNMPLEARLDMNNHLAFFADVVGGCERLVRQPIAVKFSRHTTRSMTIWLSLLPVFVANSYKAWTIPGMFFLSFTLLSIEDISVQLEEPFSVLPLRTICQRVTDGVVALQHEHIYARQIVDSHGDEEKKNLKIVPVLPWGTKKCNSEIFMTKALKEFRKHDCSEEDEEAGKDSSEADDKALQYANLWFFSWIACTYILDVFVRQIMRLACCFSSSNPKFFYDSGEEVDDAAVEEAVDGMDADHHVHHLQKVGLISAIAIAWHNFPENLATVVATLADPTAGVAIAVAVALDKIPEGVPPVLVAMPLYYSTGSKLKGCMWAFLSGVLEPIGGLFGWAVLANMGEISYAVFFAIVAGMMMFVTACELIPAALRFDPDEKYFSKSCFLLGMVVMVASILMFRA